MNKLGIGDPAPDFQASDQNGNTLHLADLKGRKCFIYFFPKAGTSG